MYSIKRLTVSHVLLAIAGIVLASTPIISRQISISSDQLVELKHQERRMSSSIVSSIDASEDSKRLVANTSGEEDTFTVVARELTAQGLKINVASSSTIAGSETGGRQSTMQFSVAGDYFHFKQALGTVMVKHSAVALEGLRLTKDRGSNLMIGELQFRSYAPIP